MQYKISHTFNMYIKHVYFISYNSILSIIIFNNNNILIIWFTFLIKKNFFKFLLNNNYNSYNNLFNNFRINYQWYNSEIKTSINDISLQFTIYNKFFLPPPPPPNKYLQLNSSNNVSNVNQEINTGRLTFQLFAETNSRSIRFIGIRRKWRWIREWRQPNSTPFKNVTAHNPCIPFAWSHALLTYHRCRMGPLYRKWIVCHASSQQPFPIQNIVLIILISHVCRESVTTTVAAAMDYHIHISCDIVFANGGKFLPGCFDRWSIANRTKIFEIKTPNWDGSSEFVPLLNFNESRHFFEFFFFLLCNSHIFEV